MNEANQKKAEENGFIFAACLICANKQGCPSSEQCKECASGKSEGISTQVLQH